LPEIESELEVYRHPSAQDGRCIFSAYRTEVPQDAGAEPILRFLGSNESEDRYGSIIDPRGGQYGAYRNNPVFLWAHDYSDLPIGKTTQLDASSLGPVFTVRFAVEILPKAKAVYELYKGGYLRGVSVGVIPKEWEPIEAKTIPSQWAENRRYTLWELLELSATPVPANRDALMMALQNKVVTENEVRSFGLEGMIYRAAPYILISRSAEKPAEVAPKAAGDTTPAERSATATDDTSPKSGANAREGEQSQLVAANVLRMANELTVLRAGRVLSKANMDKLTSALEAINAGVESVRAVLEAAGVSATVEEPPAETPTETASTEEVARAILETKEAIFGASDATPSDKETRASDASPAPSPAVKRYVDFIFSR